MAAAACDRVKFPWLGKHKRSSSEPAVDEADDPAGAAVERASTPGFSAARSISQELVREPSRAERWTDSLRKSRDRLRQRFSLRDERRPQSEPTSPSPPSQPVEAAADRSAVGKPVVRFAKTCRRDVPKPYRFLREKLSPRPRSLSPHNGSSNNEDEVVFAFGTASREPEEHIYDPVGEPADPDEPPRAADDSTDAHDDEFARFSRFSKRQPEPGRDFPKSVRFGKKRVSSDSDSVGVRFKPLSTSSSKDEDLGSYQGLQRVRVQLKDDVSGLNLVSKFVQPTPDVVALPPIEIQQLDEPPRAKIREYWESRRALTAKPPRKKKRSEEGGPRSQSADQADSRTIAIFGTASRRGAVSLLDVRDVRYADESATEESADYGDGRSYRRLLDDGDGGPYRPTRVPRRPPLPEHSTVTSKLVVDIRGGEPEREGAVQVETCEEQPPTRPRRSSRAAGDAPPAGHNDTFDSIGEGPDQLEVTLCARGSVTSEGPRSLHSFQQEELGSGDELMLIVHDDGKGQQEDEDAAKGAEHNKENRPEVELRRQTPAKPEYAHVRKRSSVLQQQEEAEYDYPPPVPKKLSELRPPSPVVPPPRRRPASLSPGRAELNGNTTWPKRRHCTAPVEPAEEAEPVAPPPRTVKRSKIRSSTVPRGYKSGRGARPTLYHLAKQRSQEDAVDMKNRPLPPPPPPPRKKPTGRSDPALAGSTESPPPPLPPPRAASPPPAPGELWEAGSEPNLSSQATDAPSEITLRSEGSDGTLDASQTTLTSGRDPGCESTDDEFFSMASESRPPPEKTAASPPTPRARHQQPQSAVQQEQQQQQVAAAGQVAAAPRHVLVPHFIQRVSTTEMDAASANIIDLTAGRIKVTELEVDRIYIREGRVKLIRHEDGSDDEATGGGGGGGGGGGDGGERTARPAPAATEPGLTGAGAPPASGPAPQARSAADPPSSSDSSDSRPPDPGLLRELDAVESLFRQIGSCLSELQQPQARRGSDPPAAAAAPGAAEDFIPRCGSDSDPSSGCPQRNSGDDVDASPVLAPAEAGPSVSARLESIKSTLEQVISPASAERRCLASGQAQQCGASGGGERCTESSDADAERIYGIPAEAVDAPGRRARLGHLFTSFGKGLKKKPAPRKERRPHSQFYVELDRSDADSDSSGVERRRSDPSPGSVSSEAVMGGSASTPDRRLAAAPPVSSEGRLQYARVIEEFSSNLATLCKQLSAEHAPSTDDGPEPEPEPEPQLVPSPSQEPEQEPEPASEALETAPELSDSDSDTETLHTACDQPPPSPDASKSYLVARELLSSEETFVDVLRLLNEDFRAAAEAVAADAKSPGVPPAELAAILCHLPELQRLNEELLRDLRSRLDNWAAHPAVADVIVRKGPFLKLYSAYIRDFQAQCHMLTDCRQRYPGFDAAVAAFEASSRCRRLSVAHYMLKPVQRLPQYRLLLEDYLRRLEVGAVDYDNTRAALEVVCEVADHANKSMREGDNFKKMLQIQERLRSSDVIKPGRSFLREGELLKLCRKGPQPRFVILLTDSLLLTRYTGSASAAAGPLGLDYTLPLAGMKVSLPVGVTDEYQNEFSIVSTTRSFSLTAGSSKERDDWVNALMGAIEKNASNRSTFNAATAGTQPSDNSELGAKAPVWVPDSRASMCQLCTAEFTVTNRRHHCRACGKVVCGDCSLGKAPLKYQHNCAARVCDVCLDALQKDLEDADVDPQNTSQSRRSSPGTVGRKALRRVPKRLEVSASVAGCQMSGCLQRRSRKQWKRFWFVLRDRVLYMYRASQDVVAMDGLCVLGYRVEPMKDSPVRSYEGVDSQLVFQLTHPNQPPLVFHADSRALADKWVTSLQGATVLT
ncbi:uncharacterized protein LOC119089919 [Pollicipes pollicipes]|uniref:uncharacterized protein LOC119089919 n=1 Tax=Pollicipes pollicipes TaxID=41117 RepID=UPI0018851634|nr:uncharacterized protein LOC119089919 [Pollicipes pollicipes]